MLTSRRTNASTSMSKTGACLCGAVSFRISGNFESFFLCHCARCRKDTGSAFAANLFSSTSEIMWLSGHDHVKTYRVPTTRHARSFCADCGSALPSVQANGALLVVPAGRRRDRHEARCPYLFRRSGRVGAAYGRRSENRWTSGSECGGRLAHFCPFASAAPRSLPLSTRQLFDSRSPKICFMSRQSCGSVFAQR
jgi:hypothetical protein